MLAHLKNDSDLKKSKGLKKLFMSKKTSSQTRKMRYPAVKLTDCGKTCTLTKLQTAEPEKFEVKFVSL